MTYVIRVFAPAGILITVCKKLNTISPHPVWEGVQAVGKPSSRNMEIIVV